MEDWCKWKPNCHVWFILGCFSGIWVGQESTTWKQFITWCISAHTSSYKWAITNLLVILLRFQNNFFFQGIKRKTRSFIEICLQFKYHSVVQGRVSPLKCLFVFHALAKTFEHQQLSELQNLELFGNETMFSLKSKCYFCTISLRLLYKYHLLVLSF